METDKPLSKKARPGEMTIRGSLKPGITAPCDYCDEGVPKEQGVHVVRDPMGFDGDQRIPCPRET